MDLPLLLQRWFVVLNGLLVYVRLQDLNVLYFRLASRCTLILISLLRRRLCTPRTLPLL